MEHIVDILCSCLALIKDAQNSPQHETLVEALKVLAEAMDEIHVGLRTQRSWRV